MMVNLDFGCKYNPKIARAAAFGHHGKFELFRSRRIIYPLPPIRSLNILRLEEAKNKFSSHKGLLVGGRRLA